MSEYSDALRLQANLQRMKNALHQYQLPKQRQFANYQIPAMGPGAYNKNGSGESKPGNERDFAGDGE